MRSTIINLAVIGGLLAAAGCAKQEIVKKEEPIAPSVAKTQPAKVEKPAPEKKAPAAQPPVTQAQTAATSQQKQAATTSDNGQLKEALEKIYFAFDSSNLDDGARQTLAKNAASMKKNTAKVRIEGNCDERGSDEYNLALGERRAKAAMQYLVTMGVPAARLSTVSYGKEKPADPGHDEAAWARNRRDDFVIR